MIVVSFPVAELFGHAKGKSFWRKSKPTKAAREEAHKAVIAAGLHKWPHDSAALKLRIVRPHRKHDPHNIPGATKAIIDGVADGLGINDRNIKVEWEIAEEIDKARPRVEISVLQKEGVQSMAEKKTAYAMMAETAGGPVIGYMDMTDFECELGAAMGGSVVYPSEADCARNNAGCIDSCGIVEVEVQFKRIVRESKTDLEMEAEHGPN